MGGGWEAEIILFSLLATPSSALGSASTLRKDAGPGGGASRESLGDWIGGNDVHGEMRLGRARGRAEH